VVDITDVIEEAKGRGLAIPGVDTISGHTAAPGGGASTRPSRPPLQEFNYQNVYRGVFPIKVNQLREVVEEILDAGRPFRFGLEVGSKPELFAGLALQNQEGSLIICNGYKDTQFIRMALMGVKLGKTVILVVEKLEELKQIIAVSRQVGVEPLPGHPPAPQQQGSEGRWAESGGDNAKFGLSTAELLMATELLRAEKMEHCFKLLHFHIGSQVPDILTIKKAVQEAARFYAKLFKMGFAIESPGCRRRPGRGLRRQPVGVRQLHQLHPARIRQRHGVSHRRDLQPGEGAASADHQRKRAGDCGASQRFGGRDFRRHRKNARRLASARCGKPARAGPRLLDIRKNIAQLHKLEAYHDALDRREEAQNMFALGLLDLPDKAKIESLYWEIGREVVQSFQGRPHMPEEIRKLEESLGDQFLCNFSVFQSLLDHWALGQLFPIMPVSRLNEAPTREGTLVDITCDSDGQVNKFIDVADVRDTLSLHSLRANGQGPEPYYLGFFLMGAYQDIMGDLHNLFGRVNEVHVFLDPDEPSGYYVEDIIEGSTIVQTLTAVQYDEHELQRQMKMQVDEAIKSDRLKPSEGMRLLDDFERGLKDYTYLTS
jgi:arginine decarboxylase